MSFDFDNNIASHMSSLSQSVDDKIIAMSEGLLSKFSQMLGQFKFEVSNASFSAEPEISGRMPVSGQCFADAPPCQN